MTDLKMLIHDELFRQSNTPIDGFGSDLHFGSDSERGWFVEGYIDPDALERALVPPLVTPHSTWEGEAKMSRITISRLETENERLREALRGVIRVADRDTPEFRAAHAELKDD